MGLCHQFLLFHVFPPASSDLLQLSQGRWACHFSSLVPATSSSFSLTHAFVTKLSSAQNGLQMDCAHISSMAPVILHGYCLPFLFPALRCGLLKQLRPDICLILFRASDYLFDSSAVASILNNALEKPDTLPMDLSLNLLPSLTAYVR